MGANAQTEVSTFTAGQVLTAAQLNNTARTGVPVFATTTTRDAAFGGTGEKTLAEGQLAYIEATDVVQYYDGSAWQTLAPGGVKAAGGGYVATGQTTTSTSYVDLATAGPSVTVTTGTLAIVSVTSIQSNSAGNANANVGNCFHSYAVSGASTIGAADASSARGGQTFANQIFTRSSVMYLATLTAGSNTFTSKYRVSDGTGTFSERHIAVWAL
jgi:hypothetical protein